MITQQDIEDMGYGYYTLPNKDLVPDMVAEFATRTDAVGDEVLYLKLIKEEYSEFIVEVAFRSPEKDQLKELADLVYVIYGYARTRGWDLDEAIRRVHANNLGRCIQPDGQVHYRADGKVLKNKDYPKVNLEDLVND